ncbi:hypothetical protein BGW38_002787 [Lunasporangiospora selenospora]|uniref:Uncharacterized protein n=1 Tax=Lunasporangiospora selenospora TaxID=979761 RepID=A0A9P6KDA4_9FUNG|nr:hypothetical protein BGW38_002787 [Lunasporangiospora selenospora]
MWFDNRRHMPTVPNYKHKHNYHDNNSCANGLYMHHYSSGVTPEPFTTCDNNRCQQEGTEAVCIVDCGVRIQFGAFYGVETGSVYYIDQENNYAISKLYDSKNTGDVWSIAVNRNETEYKAAPYGKVWRGHPWNYWDRVESLDSSGIWNNYQLDAYGSRKDGWFVQGSAYTGGKIWAHAPNSTTKTEYQYTYDPATRGNFGPILDLALDGDDYAWITNAYYYLYIARRPQSGNNWGGPVKLIGYYYNSISGYAYGASWGIAFDDRGNIYYGGGTGTGWMAVASARDPLNPRGIFRLRNQGVGDLASCAYPKVGARDTHGLDAA